MLPIHDVLPELQAALAARTCAVLAAPPGAGKTTVVPLALLEAAWRGDGRILMLEPRRLAARAAAERMARTLGEKVGETVGFRVRLQSRVSARTRIEVVTEGVFTRMILDDPGLSGVACVIFDEFHERSLDADLGLALARDSQGLVRDDLRILVMSATLDGAAVSRLLDDAPVIESIGRMFPVDTRYLGRDPRQRIEDGVVRAVERALAEEEGGVLAFLPGQGEIRRAAEALAERVRRPDVEIAPLYGALDPAAQDRAIAPAPPGKRKVVLATAIAETSLTLEGVRVVVDGGVARVPRYDPASGLTPPILNVLAIAAIPVVLIIAATQIGFLQGSLLTQPLTGPQWLACLGLALALPLVIESAKWIRRRQAAPSTPINAQHVVAPARAVTGDTAR